MSTRLKYLCLVGFLVLCFYQNASAELAAVGPENATHGFALELCLTPGNCVFDPIVPGNSFSQQIGFGEKAFYWSANAQLSVGPGGTGTATLDMALVASFSGSIAQRIPLDGEQITFLQITIGPINNLVPGGIYMVTHPFGVLDNLVADASGVIPEQRQDIGCAAAPCDNSVAALGSRVGPFLKWDSSLPAPPFGFIGNPTVAHKVTGSPFGDNFFGIEGPNAGGLGIDVKATDLFKVQGKIFTGTVPTPLMVDRATYTRPLPTAVDVIAASVPSATLQVSGTGIATTTMVGDGTGKFFAHIPFAGAPPDSIIVTANNPPRTATTIKKALLDVVTIHLAEYNSSTSTLTIEASSSDQLVPPPLTAMGFGNLALGKLVVPNLIVPPATVIVISLAGGSDTTHVFVTANIQPVARNDTALTQKNIAVVIDVLANDAATSGTLDPTTVTVVTPPAHGTTSVNPAGEVTYTPGLDFIGNDSFRYTVQDSLARVSNIATANITVVENEVLTVTKAVFTRSLKWWQISGKSTVMSGNIITLYLGADTTGRVIGAATVNRLGNWSFSKLLSPVVPGTATSITALSTLGTVVTFPLTIR
jgi:hypothetical protein